MQPRFLGLAAGLAALVLAGVMATGCLRSPSFECTSSAQCMSSSGPGQCVQVGSAGYCAFPDDTCSSGLRFDESAGADQDGQCAEGEAARPDAVLCRQGAARSTGENACVASVCERLPACCTSAWTSQCVQLTEIQCKRPCADRIALVGTGALVVMDGQGASWEPTVLTPDATQLYRSVSWADFDGNGTEELLVSTADFNSSNKSVQGIWSYQPGPQLAPFFDLLTLPAVDSFASYLGVDTVVGDRDHDGDLDLSIVGQFPSALFADYLRNGQFKPGPVAPDEVRNYAGSSGDFGDVDGDGDLDLAIGNYSTGEVAVLDLAKTPRVVWLKDLGNTSVRVVAFGDVDGDRDLDLAVGGTGFVSVFLNNGGTFGDQPVFERLSTDDTPELLWLDADEDGDFDLLTGNYDSDGKPLRLFVNEGGGLLPNPSWSSLEQLRTWRLDAGDVDGDGDLDVAVAVEGLSRIYLNEGDNTFSVGWTAKEDGLFYGVDITKR